MAEVLRGAMAGAVGGLMGTAMMQQGMKLTPRLPPKLQPPELKGDPGEYMTQKAEELMKRELPRPVHEGLAQGLHWAYGAFWPMALGMAVRQSAFRSWGKALATGAGLGAGVWAVSYLGWLPRTSLVVEHTEKKIGRQGMALLSHIAYGILSVAPLYATGRLWPRRRYGKLSRFFRRW